MFRKQKIRRTLLAIAKRILIVVLSIAIVFAGVASSVLSATIASITSSDYSDERITIATGSSIIDNTDDKEEVVIQTESISPKHWQSTMQLMITGQEIAKGDRSEALARKAQRIARRRALIRKRKLARIRRQRALRRARLRRQRAWLSQFYTPQNVVILSHLIEGEAGDQDDACQQSVGQVVMNRVKSKHFPNTVEGVVFAPRQYACTWDGNYDRTPSKQAVRNAKAVLTGNVCVKVPRNVVYQSQFRQGSGIWKQLGTEIFCFE